MRDQGTRSRLRPALAGLSLVAACVGACILPEVDLDGRSCPCAARYTCDVATDTCIEGDAAAASSSTGGTAPSSSQGEGPSTTDTSSSGSGSNAGGGGQGGDGAGGSGGEAGVGASGGGAVTGSTGSGGSGGHGGSGGCEVGQTTNVPMCGALFDTFDDPALFGANFSLSGPASAFAVENSQLTMTMSNQTPLVAFADETFDLVGCAATVRLITAPDAPDILGRLSIGTEGAASRYSIGVIQGTLQARDEDTVIVAMDYDPVDAAYLRIREEAGSLYFGTSADGICWDDVGDLVTAETLGVTARLVLISEGSAAPATVVFDDFNFLP